MKSKSRQIWLRYLIDSFRSLQLNSGEFWNVVEKQLQSLSITYVHKHNHPHSNHHYKCTNRNQLYLDMQHVCHRGCQNIHLYLINRKCIVIFRVPKATYSKTSGHPISKNRKLCCKSLHFGLQLLPFTIK